jgi:hypothetical protein
VYTRNSKSFQRFGSLGPASNRGTRSGPNGRKPPPHQGATYSRCQICCTDLVNPVQRQRGNVAMPHETWRHTNHQRKDNAMTRLGIRSQSTLAGSRVVFLTRALVGPGVLADCEPIALIQLASTSGFPIMKGRGCMARPSLPGDHPMRQAADARGERWHVWGGRDYSRKPRKPHDQLAA